MNQLSDDASDLLLLNRYVKMEELFVKENLEFGAVLLSSNSNPTNSTNSTPSTR